MEPLLFGAAYYPEYEPYERTETDLRMMREAGINVIRMAESTWSTWERREGEYDFSLLTRTLDLCEKTGMQVIIGTPTYAVPAWLVKKDPKVMVVDESGRRKYGARQIMDIMNPTYREHAERIIRKLCEAVSGYRCVIGFQLDNETKHYGTSGGRVRRLFRMYLQGIFGTVEELNREFGFAYWSNSIADWEDLPDVRGTINGSYACEFQRFQRKLASDFLMWQRRIVDEYRREDQFVTHNLDFFWKEDPELSAFGYSYGVQPGINHYRASKALTVCGTDIYHPTQEHLTGEEIAYGGDSIRALTGTQYLVLETEAQAYPNWTPFPGQLYLQAMSHLASGARMVEYWNWHSIHNSAETYWKGILSHDMEENRVYREIKRIGEDMRKLSLHLAGFRKRNRAALLIDNRSLAALGQFPIAENVTYNDVILEYHRALYEQNIECDVVDVQAVTDAALKRNAAAGLPYDGELPGAASGMRNPVLARYEAVITPVLYVASDLLIGELKEYVRQGGTLVSSFKSFFTGLHMKVRAERQPYHLTDVFGMSYQEFTVPGTAVVGSLPVRGFMELLMPGTAEAVYTYEHRYWGEYAAVTRNCFEKGTAWYIGGLVDPMILKTVLKRAVCREDGAGEGEACRVLPDGRAAVWPVIIRSGENAAGRKLHFFLNYSEEEKQVIFPRDLTDILSGERFPSGSAVSLEDWGARVLMETEA